MNVPVHNYMTYKKESSLGYFSEIRPKNHSAKDQNEVYKTMKSFYLISKIFRSLKKEDKSKSKHKIKSQPKKLPTLQNRLARQIDNKTQFKQTTLILNTSSGQQSLTRKKRKSLPVSYQRTKTQIEDIKTRADHIYSNLTNNKHQIRFVTRYNKLLDTYFDKIPSPTASITRQALEEQERFNKICKKDIFLELHKDKLRNGWRTIDEFHQPEIPEHVMEKLVRKNKQDLEYEKNRKQLKKNNKIRIKQKFLSYFDYGKQAQKIAERAKSQGLINISNL